MDDKYTNDIIDSFHGMLYAEKERRGYQMALRATDLKAMNTEWVSTGQAAKMLGVRSVNTIKRWAHEGKLEYRKPGSWMQISMRSIYQLLELPDPELISIREMEHMIDETKELNVELTEDVLNDLSEERYGRLPWKK